MAFVHGPRTIVAAGALVVLAGLAACLGDDPARIDEGSESDGGTNGDAQPDSGALGDSGDASTVASGSLDDTYAAGPVPLALDTARAAALDDLGRLYVAGTHSCPTDAGTTSCFAVIRLLPNGAVDTVFGTQGRVMHRVTTGSAPYYLDGAWSIALDRDRLILGGESNRHPAPGNFGAPTIVTLATDGALDHAPAVLDGDGVVWSLAPGAENTGYHAMYGAVSRALPADTKLHGGAAVAHYSRDADVQLTATEVANALPSIAGLAFVEIAKSDFTYVTGPSSSRRIGVARVTSLGAVDTGWAGSGSVSISVGEGDAEGHGIAILGDGRIVVAGVSGIDPGGTGFGGHRGPLTLVRLSASGQKDATYGNVSATGGGAFVSPLLKREASNFEDPEIVVDDQGRVVVAGLADADTAAESSAALTRVSADGRPDETFGEKGIVRCGPSKDSRPVATLRDPATGKLLLVARRQSEVYVCRYHP